MQMQRQSHRRDLSKDQDIFKAESKIKAAIGSLKDGRREIIRNIREIAEEVDKHNRK